MDRRFGLLQAFAVSFAFGFLATLVIALVISAPFGFLLGLFGAAQYVVMLDLLTATVGGMVFGIVGVVVFSVWRALTRPQQFALVAFLLVVGILSAQPEVDAIALLGAVFTMVGVSKRGGRGALA